MRVIDGIAMQERLKMIVERERGVPERLVTFDSLQAFGYDRTFPFLLEIRLLSESHQGSCLEYNQINFISNSCLVAVTSEMKGFRSLHKIFHFHHHCGTYPSTWHSPSLIQLGSPSLQLILGNFLWHLCIPESTKDIPKPKSFPVFLGLPSGTCGPLPEWIWMDGWWASLSLSSSPG